MELRVRVLTTNEDLHRVPPLEQSIWGNPDPIPDSLLRVMADHGGGVWVATPADVPETWLGFAVALPGCDGTGWYLHSHLAGVVASRRRQGIGLALKLHQRQWARARGYSRICWTFDPLRAANAHFNLVRLGVRVVEYRVDYYGTLNSTLNRALPTDRLLVEWPTEPAAVDSVMVDHDEPPAFIPIPPDLDAVMIQDPAGADAWLRSVRAKFHRCLMAGYVVTGFDRNASPPRYILRKGSHSPQLSD